MTVPITLIEPEELAERHRIGELHRHTERSAAIDDQVRGLRIGINTLIREEKKLLAEQQALKPKIRDLSGKGGA